MNLEKINTDKISKISSILFIIGMILSTISIAGVIYIQYLLIQLL